MQVKQLQDQTGTDIQPNVPDKTGYPDWANRDMFTWNTTHTATDDGWVSPGANVQNTSWELTIDGNYVSSMFGSNLMGIRGHYPIKKGQTFKVTGGTSYTELWFMKNVTNTNGGGLKQFLTALATSLNHLLTRGLANVS